MGIQSIVHPPDRTGSVLYPGDQTLAMKRSTKSRGWDLAQRQEPWGSGRDRLPSPQGSWAPPSFPQHRAGTSVPSASISLGAAFWHLQPKLLQSAQCHPGLQQGLSADEDPTPQYPVCFFFFFHQFW